MTMKDALTYIERGWQPIALHHVEEDGTCSCGETEDGHAIGKHPRERGWQKNPALSVADVHTLWEKWPDANVGIATGTRSGFFVLDVDPKNGGDATLAEFEAEHGKMPDTYLVETGSGGRHYYFSMPEDFEPNNSAGRLGPGLDIRGNGGQVVAPSSVSGEGSYRVLSDTDPAPAPTPLLDAIRPPEQSSSASVDSTPRADAEIERYVASAVAGEVERVRQAGELDEDRNITLNRSTFSLASIAAHEDSGLGIEAVRERMHEAGMATGLGVREVYATVDSGIRGGLAKPRDPWPPPSRAEALFLPFSEEQVEWPQREWDDLGNADRYVDHYGGKVLWIIEDEAWAVYDGSRWVRGQDALAQSMAQNMISRLPSTEALSYSPQRTGEDPSPREMFASFVAKQRSAAKVTALLRSARGIPELHASATDFDQRKELLNARNGVIDILTGEVSDHDPEQRIMLQTRAAIHPDATCPTWMAFLERTQPDADVREFLQRVVGYSLTGFLSEQVMVMHHGSGANGKSVFLKVLGDVFGSYSQVVPRSTLITKRSEGIATDVARMVGRRFLQTSETAAGRQLDEEIIKSITGGDTQVARHLYGREFEFTPQGTIHYATNHLPRLTDAESIWRRLILISWDVVIPPSERDGHLADKIVEREADGVLAWAIRGAAKWRDYGLGVPLSARLALDEYREDSDLFGDFLRDETVVMGPDYFSTIEDLYRGYSEWCFHTGTNPVAQNTLGRMLKERGWIPARRRDGGPQRRGFLGHAIRSQIAVEFRVERDGLLG